MRRCNRFPPTTHFHNIMDADDPCLQDGVVRSQDQGSPRQAPEPGIALREQYVCEKHVISTYDVGITTENVRRCRGGNIKQGKV